jgi:hypothetical protein
MKVILDTDIPLTESPDTNHVSFANESESQRLHRVGIMEDTFEEELTFLFYLNLNTSKFSIKIENPLGSKPLKGQIEQWVVEQKRILDYLLRSPKDRLMAIFTKDNGIKQCFTERISDIMRYREQTLNKMYEFYNEILDSHKYSKKEQSRQSDENNQKAEITFHILDIDREEYDIEKICYFQSK